MKTKLYVPIYEAPEISVITIDKEITLVLVSPPIGPDEGMNAPEHNHKSPVPEFMA